MLLVISPAKTLDFSPQSLHKTSSKPELLTQSKKLIAQLRELSPRQIGKLMGISEKLSADVHRYVADWKAKYDATGSKQAVLAFRGDVYQGLDADSFGSDDFDFAQQHLRILSGLYGVLRPLDLMQAYRLEMGTKFASGHVSNLYAFWGERIARSLQTAMDEQGDAILVNLASNEYFKGARAKQLDCRVITPAFKDRKNGDYKMIGYFAKKARGMMARHIIRNRITAERDLHEFRAAGYQFNHGLSSDGHPVFTRDKVPAI